MYIAVFGLGYVGTICGSCLAAHGHHVIGVDVQQAKVDLLNSGTAPVIEPGLQELLSQVVGSGHFKATTDTTAAVENAEVILVCVGTPSQRDGSLNLTYLQAVIREIAQNIAAAAAYPVIAIRSTVPPGTLADCARILAETSQFTAGKDFGIVANPEFLREGSALHDFENAPYTLVGSEHPRAIEVMRGLYQQIDAPFMATSTGAAEIIKYVNNSFHALKIAFSNEIGILCKTLGIDSHEVMDLVCSDTKLNISPAYMKPGFAYGGSCLPKDLEALNQSARRRGLRVPVLASIADSNARHLKHSIRLIEDAGNKQLGFLGLSFKAQTDDLRQSPAVEIIETLLGRGYKIRIFDPNINMARLIGANRDYIENHIKHLSELLVPSQEDIVGFAETIIVTNNDPSYNQVLERANNDQTIIDMTRLPGSPKVSEGRYHGICW